MSNLMTYKCKYLLKYSKHVLWRCDWVQSEEVIVSYTNQYSIQMDVTTWLQDEKDLDDDIGIQNVNPTLYDTKLCVSFQ